MDEKSSVLVRLAIWASLEKRNARSDPVSVSRSPDRNASLVYLAQHRQAMGPLGSERKRRRSNAFKAHAETLRLVPINGQKLQSRHYP